MKKQLFLFGLLLVSLCKPSISSANRAAGGSLVYEWISDSTYRFIFMFYADCSGDTADATVPLCFKNPCTNTGFTVIMKRYNGYLPGGGPNGGPVSAGCSQIKSTCDTPTSTFPGFKEYWYSDTVTLPSRCNAWKAYTYINYRNASNNIQNATTKQMYIECGFNNSDTAYRTNSSPYFSIRPIPYVCLSSAYSYNNGAIDANGDSLVTDIIAPLTGVSSCADIPTNVVLNSASPALLIPSNPFQTNNTFTLNSSTGQVNFTASQLGSNALTMRVKEYRKSVLVGWVIRDIDVIVLNCTQPTFNFTVYDTLNNVLSQGNSTFQVCIGQKLSFKYRMKASDPNTIIKTEDNHIFSIPGASINYYNQLKDSVLGIFSWTPTAADTGIKGLIITTKDSTCRPPGIMMYYTNSILITVQKPTIATNDTSVCVGTLLNLKVSGTGNYTWSVLPGGSSGSLSCTNCTAPIATPTSTTKYVVTSSIHNCPNNKDTVIVTVTPVYLNTVAYGDTTICSGDYTNLTATGGTGSYIWSVLPGGQKNSLNCYNCATPVANPDSTTKYILLSNANNCYNNRDTVTVIVNPKGNKSPSIYISPDNPAVLMSGATVKFTAKITNCTNYQLQWVRNGIDVTNENNTVWVTNTIQNNDVVTCKFICNDPCPTFIAPPVSNSIKMYVVTSVEQISYNSGISIAPNPNNGKFTVDLKNITGETTLSVTNTLGETIYTQTCFGGKQQEISLDAPKGMYFLHINNSVLKFVITP